jgi:deoxyribodipyrimidine photo-lyase
MTRTSRPTNDAPTLVWFRLDLRLADNPALLAAVDRGKPVIPVFIWSPDDEKPWPPGAASRWWLHQSLASLQAALAKRGSRLILRAGPMQATIERLLHETQAGAVFWNRRYEPSITERDRKLKDALRQAGCVAESFNSSLLFEPWTIKNQSGKPFRVFTPFWNHCLRQPLAASPRPEPQQLPVPERWPQSESLETLRLEPSVNWAGGLKETWQPGELGASQRVAGFLGDGLSDYNRERDRPDHLGTAMLSPHLHFGEISPTQLWHAVQQFEANKQSRPSATAQPFLRQLVWREFAHHLLYHFPETQTKPLRPEYAGFPFRTAPRDYQAWCRGQTGYPLVDAGMRQLWHCGWMHNRVRMVVASFLVKHLLIGWDEGAAWFWDTLVDADLANNTLGWQWAAGCGADAAPYFRIFNPVSQGTKFDPKGDYVRRWVPELANVPSSSIHQPWDRAKPTPKQALENGKSYPPPIVPHMAARQRALGAWATIRR